MPENCLARASNPKQKSCPTGQQLRTGHFFILGSQFQIITPLPLKNRLKTVITAGHWGPVNISFFSALCKKLIMRLPQSFGGAEKPHAAQPFLAQRLYPLKTLGLQVFAGACLRKCYFLRQKPFHIRKKNQQQRVLRKTTAEDKAGAWEQTIPNAPRDSCKLKKRFLLQR